MDQVRSARALTGRQRLAALIIFGPLVAILVGGATQNPLEVAILFGTLAAGVFVLRLRNPIHRVMGLALLSLPLIYLTGGGQAAVNWGLVLFALFLLTSIMLAPYLLMAWGVLTLVGTVHEQWNATEDTRQPEPTQSSQPPPPLPPLQPVVPPSPAIDPQILSALLEQTAELRRIGERLSTLEDTQ